MTSTQLPTAQDAVNGLLGVVRLTFSSRDHEYQLRFARKVVLNQIVDDARENAGKRVRYYADQLDQLDLLTAQWYAASQAAELCTDGAHFEQFRDEPGQPDLQA